MNNRKDKINYIQIILLIMCLIAVLSLIYTSLTYGQVRLDSDTEMTYRFWNSMKSARSFFPKSWNFANGELYIVSRFPLNILLFYVFDNPLHAIIATSAITALVVCISLLWLSECVFENKAWAIIVTMYCLYLCSENARDMIMFQASYNTVLIFICILVGLFIKIMSSSSLTASRRNVIVFSICLYLVMMMGTRYLAEFILPALATLVVILVFEKLCLKNDSYNLTRKLFILISVPPLLGYLSYRLICSTHNMVFGTTSNPTLRFNLEYLLYNVEKTINNIVCIFGYSVYNRNVVNWVTFVVAALLIIIIPVAQIIEYKNLTKKEATFLVFCFMHNAEMFLVIVLSGLLEERYLLSSVFLSLIISGNYIYKLLIKLNKLHSIPLLLGYVLFTAFLCRDLIKLTNSWQEKLDVRTNIANELVEKGVTKGYATYWMGYPFEVYSKGEITIGGVDFTQGSFVKQYSNNDCKVFDYKEGRSCIILSEEEALQMKDNLGDNYIDRMVEEPCDVIELESPEYKELYNTSKLIIFIFDEDVCEKLSDGILDGILTPREMDYNKIGSRTDEAIYLTNGGMVHGPYATIAPGEYYVTISGTYLNDCTSEIVSFSNPDVIKYTVDSQSNEEICMTLTVKKYVDDIQFYLTNLGNETVEFHGVNIQEKSR